MPVPHAQTFCQTVLTRMAEKAQNLGLSDRLSVSNGAQGIGIPNPNNKGAYSKVIKVDFILGNTKMGLNLSDMVYRKLNSMPLPEKPKRQLFQNDFIRKQRELLEAKKSKEPKSNKLPQVKTRHSRYSCRHRESLDCGSQSSQVTVRCVAEICLRSTLLVSPATDIGTEFKIRFPTKGGP